jgi:hypothetical protein
LLFPLFFLPCSLSSFSVLFHIAAELGFEDISPGNNTIQQAHHKKDDAQFTAMHGGRAAIGANNLPKLCWPQGEAPTHPQLQPNCTETLTAAATRTRAGGATLVSTTPPTDGELVVASIHAE